MIINFKRIYEMIFKSFVVARDSQMIERLAADGYTEILLIKRSWLYGLASSIWLIPLFILGGANIYLILRHFDYSDFGILLASLLGLTIIGTLYSSIRYLYDYRKSYGNSLDITTPQGLANKLLNADGSFTKCFNQLQFNFLFFIGIIIVYVCHIFFIATEIELLFAILDVVCISFQLMLIRRFVHLTIDLEMDFNIAVRGKLFFVEQNGVYSGINTLDSDKIKNIRSSYPNFFASFFHFGTIEVLTEGDESMLGHNIMNYVDQPERTVENLNKLMSIKNTQ